MNEPTKSHKSAEAALAALRADARRIGMATSTDPQRVGVELESAEELLERLRSASADWDHED